MSCCDTNGLNRMFSGSYVEREKRTFLKRGLSERQQAFFESLDLDEKSILDLGCGIGALGLTALQRGAERAHLVDVSQASLRLAQELRVQLDLSGATFTQGDGARLELSTADIVVLDRVVCCYPDAGNLLRKASSLSECDLLFTYPLARWWLRLGRSLLNLSMVVTRNDYRFYVHSEDHLLDAAAQHGHRLKRRQRYGVWQFCHFSKL